MDKFLGGAKQLDPAPESAARPAKRVLRAEASRPALPKRECYSAKSVLEELENGNYDSRKPPFLNTVEQPLPFFLVAETLAVVGDQKGKNSSDAKRQLLKNMFLTFLRHEPASMGSLFLFLSGRLAEDWAKKVTNVGAEILKKAIQTATGAPLKTLNENLRSLGDLGLAFERARAGQNTLPTIFGGKAKEVGQFSFAAVFSVLRGLADLSGENSQTEREFLLAELLRALGPLEGKFVCRFLVGGLGVGAAEKVQVIALSRALGEFFTEKGWESGDVARKELDQPAAFDLSAELALAGELLAGRAPPPRIAQIPARWSIPTDVDYEFWELMLTKILTECPDHCLVIDKLLATRSLSRVRAECRITPMMPCKPMLAKPTKELSAIFGRLEGCAFTCEFKYDGLRGQAHMDGTALRIFSRNLDDLSETYPELAAPLLSLAAGRSLIVDGEIVAWDRAAGRVLPFQLLTSRAKKNAEPGRATEVCFFLFDVLYLDGCSLLGWSLAARRRALSGLLAGAPPALRLAEHRDCAEVPEIQAFLGEAVAAGCEGLMVKLLAERSSYEPAKRSFKWLKVKKDYIENGGLGDSLDLVVVGANFGEGKRRGRYGAFLVAAANPDLGTFEPCCLVGTGISDAQLAEFKARFDGLVVAERPAEYVVERNGEAQVWFRPEVVWEIKAADVQLSPVYACGRQAAGRGLGLRFPRLLRERPDKAPDQCTTSRFIVDLYRAQAALPLLDDDDYY